jgi:hypothetical protein
MLSDHFVHSLPILVSSCLERVNFLLVATYVSCITGAGSNLYSLAELADMRGRWFCGRVWQSKREVIFEHRNGALALIYWIEPGL